MISQVKIGKWVFLNTKNKDTVEVKIQEGTTCIQGKYATKARGNVPYHTCEKVNESSAWCNSIGTMNCWAGFA